MTWPGLYETESGFKFKGCPISEIPKRLRENGWRGVPRLDSYECRRMGLKVVKARYVGGVYPKQFCDVVLAELRWNFRTGVSRCSS
jgi:hypothetical protein